MSFQTQSPRQTNLNLKFLLEEIKILTQENSRLARDNKELATRILELEGKLKTNSSNSSKPPCSLRWLKDPIKYNRARARTRNGIRLRQVANIM